MKKIIFKTLLFSLLITNVCYDHYTSKQVDSIMGYAMEKFNVAGVAVAIVKDGEVIHSKGYGIKSSDTKNL
jgi:CubicO group peptidase (beta-lactamase class C family)